MQAATSLLKALLPGTLSWRVSAFVRWFINITILAAIVRTGGVDWQQ